LLFWYLWGLIDFASFKNTMTSAKPSYLVGAAGIFLLNGVVLRSLKWLYLLRTVGIELKWIEAVKIYWVSNFFNLFLPGRTGGDFYKVGVLFRRTDKRVAGIASVLMDRITNFYSFLILATIGLIWKWEYFETGIQALILGADIISVLAIGLFGFKSIDGLVPGWLKFSKIDQLYSSMAIYLRQWKLFARVMILAILIQGLLIANNYLIGRSVGLEIGISYYLIYVTIISFVTLIPISISGFGIRENAFLYFFSSVATREQSLALPILGYILMLIVNSFGGLIFVVDKTSE